MAQQISMFGTTVLKSTHLIAESKRSAFYNLYIEIVDRNIFIRKESGTGDKILDTRRWKFENYADAEKKFNQIIKSKINPKRKSPRKYKILKPA